MKLDFWDYLTCISLANFMVTGIFTSNGYLFFIGAGGYFLYETLCIKEHEKNN